MGADRPGEGSGELIDTTLADGAGAKESACAGFAPLTKAQLMRYARRHVGVQLYDESGALPEGTAIYLLSDPRDIRQVRYVGQTNAPRRRFLQHLNAAMLWLPDERPWWIKSPRLRPLSGWIRELYRDELRMPTMVICAWAGTVAAARLAERTRIYECLGQRLPLLNVENEILGRQIALL
jgi:hypothetical protein